MDSLLLAIPAPFMILHVVLWDYFWLTAKWIVLAVSPLIITGVLVPELIVRWRGTNLLYPPRKKIMMQRCILVPISIVCFFLVVVGSIAIEYLLMRIEELGVPVARFFMTLN